MNLERLELFKILEPNFKIDRILSLTKGIEYEGLTINEGIYVVSEPFRGFLGYKVVTLIDLEKTMNGHNFDISGKTHEKGFSCWRINLDYFLENGIKGWNIPPKYRRCFKVVKPNQLTSFLYKEDE